MRLSKSVTHSVENWKYIGISKKVYKMERKGISTEEVWKGTKV